MVIIIIIIIVILYEKYIFFVFVIFLVTYGVPSATNFFDSICKISNVFDVTYLNVYLYLYFIAFCIWDENK